MKVLNMVLFLCLGIEVFTRGGSWITREVCRARKENTFEIPFA